MLLNPLTNTLYTDSGEKIKKLSCVYRMQWDSMNSISEKERLCSVCTHPVSDTATFSDEELLELVRKNPEPCLKVDLEQNNLRINHEIHVR